MHDTYLLDRVSQSIEEICKENKIKRMDRLTLVVHQHSHINEENLREHLKRHNRGLIGVELRIEIQRGNIEDQTAIIQSIQGENLEI